jgi:DNA polymerase-3 subunit gamma/tau
LLKTLEEPPANVKFIFATTEIREVPQTILSRCQRFDLRRLDEKEIFEHLKNILKKENFEADDQALNLIAKASEGSVRDSLSILDQALASNNHDKFLRVEIIEKMLGLSDRFKIIELLENLLKGDFILAQKNFVEIYATSSDIRQIANDLLELIHKISSIKLIKNYEIDAYSKTQFEKLSFIANNVEISNLIRVWQLISKSIYEISTSTSAKMVFEMLMIRICHLISLPDLKQVLLESYQQKNPTASTVQADLTPKEQEQNNFDLVSQILKSFEGSKIV